MISFIAQVPAVGLFLFIFWKRLKEDYSATLIFNSAFVILILVLAGGLLSFKFFPDWWFWFSLGGAFIGFCVSILKDKLSFYETLEALTIGLLPWLGIMFFIQFILYGEFATGIAALFVSVMIFVYFLLDQHYKSFSWYRSGRVGFSGLTILGTFFLIRAGVAIFFPSMLSFTGIFDAIISGLLSFASFVAVFNLSRKVL